MKTSACRQYFKEKPRTTKNNSLFLFRTTIKSISIKIGGILTISHLSYELKHQVLLNKDHPLSRILFQHYHGKVHHAGCEQTLAESREKVKIAEG